MRKTIIVSSACMAFAAVNTCAQAQYIGMNFANGWPAPRVEGEMSNGFSNWTDSISGPDDGHNVANSEDARAVTTLNGAPGVSVAWNSRNMWQAGSEGNSDQALYRVYLDDGDDPSIINELGQNGDRIGVAVRFSGLSSWLTANNLTGYRLHFYRSSDFAEGFQPVDIRDGSNLTATIVETVSTLESEGDWDFPTGGSVPSGQTVRRGHQVSSVHSLDTITLTIPNWQENNRGSLAAVGIEGVPEPATMTLLSVGALSLLRKRKQ